MIEVMIAVLVLGLVVAASLKLVALSERGLYQVREREALLDEANRYMIELSIDPTNLFGTSGDVSWNVEEKESDLFPGAAEAMEGLRLFGDESLSVDIEKLKGGEQRWRELEIIKKGESITLFLPYNEQVDLSSNDLLRSRDG